MTGSFFSIGVCHGEFVTSYERGLSRINNSQPLLAKLAPRYRFANYVLHFYVRTTSGSGEDLIILGENATIESTNFVEPYDEHVQHVYQPDEKCQMPDACAQRLQTIIVALLLGPLLFCYKRPLKCKPKSELICSKLSADLRPN